MSIPRLAAGRPIGVAMLFLAVVMVGLVSLRRLPIDLLPDVSYPQLVVYTADPGVSPVEMERSITEMIEQGVASVPGVQQVESVSREGISLVTVRFAWGADMDFAALNLRERLDNLRAALPFSAAAPVVLRTDPRSEPILTISVSGASDLLALKELSEQVFKRRLEQLDGVAHAAVTGGLEREIQVDVDPRLLESYNLTIDQIAQALSGANAAGTGGTIRQGRYRYALRTLGEFRTAEEIGNVSLNLQGGPGGAGSGNTGATGGSQTGTPTNASILLRDVATVTDGVRERESIARYAAAASDETGDGKAAGEAIGILVFKTAGDNTVSVAESVESTLAELGTEYPEVRLEVAMSQAGFISSAISNVQQELVMGGVLAFLVLFLFLRQPRYPLAIAVAIPISVLGCFALLDAFGVTLNIMTLGGLALGVGMLMDNSIIVLENVFRHREMGKGPFEAAILGAEEVGGAIMASTFTTIAVFAPILYIEGIAGELLGSLSMAVAFSLIVSIVVALVLVPVLAARWLDVESAATGPSRNIRRLSEGRFAGVKAMFSAWFDAFDRAFARFAHFYHEMLVWSLAHRGRVVGASALLLVVTLAIGSYLPRSVLPDVDQGAFRLRLELEQGTPLERTTATAEQIETVLLADPAVSAVLMQIGQAGAFAGIDVADTGLHTALVEVRLKNGESTDDAVTRILQNLNAGSGVTSVIPSPSASLGAGSTSVIPSEVEGSALSPATPYESLHLPPGSITIESGGATAFGRIVGGSEADLAVRIRGDDLDAALAYASRVEERLRQVRRLSNVRVGTVIGQPEIRVEVDREAAASFGIEPGQVVAAIQNAMRGAEATQFADFDRRVPVLVRYPADARYSLTTLDELRVDGVPVRQLVSLHPGLGPSEVRRLEQGRLVPVFADVASGGLGRALEDTQSALDELEVPPGLRVEIGGENEEMRRSFRDLAFAFGIAILLVYMILAAQFESVVHPFTILLAVPLALIGAIWALGLAGVGLNSMSLIGIVILVGIVDNDAIIKVDMINQLRREGLPVREAIMEAGRTRLRPIIMTTVTTVFGMLPLALGIGSGAALQAPMAIAIIGGLTVATFLTLLVIPVAYDLIEEVQQRLTGEGKPVTVEVGEIRPKAPVGAAAE